MAGKCGLKVMKFFSRFRGDLGIYDSLVAILMDLVLEREGTRISRWEERGRHGETSEEWSR